MAQSSSFDFGQSSTPLPWDLQRQLDALLASSSSSSSAQPQAHGASSSSFSSHQQHQQYRDPIDHSDFDAFGGSGGYGYGAGSSSGGGTTAGAMGAGGQGGAGDSSESRSSLRVPFFRFFGPTAYTPGLRRVKVELRSEPQEDQTSGQQDPSLVESRPTPAGGRASSFSSSTSNHQQDFFQSDNTAVSPSTSGSHPSPDDYESRHGRSTAESPSRSRAEEHRRRLFKRGRDKAFPTDEIFEELLDVFFKTLASNYPFLSRARIISQHRSRTLPALLANSICALASRFSSHPLLLPLRSSAEKLWESATPFEDQAKQLLIPLLSFPTEETCTALVLLAYNEFGGGRDSGLFMYTGMAIRVVQDLGMQHEISLAPHAASGGLDDGQREEIARRRLLFWAVFQLDRIISWGTGRRATIAESEIDVALPTIEDCELLNPPSTAEGVPRAPHPWPALIFITRHRGKISDSLNSPTPSTDQKSRERVERLQGNMIAFYSSMHPVLHFSVQSFKLYRDLHLSPTFLLLHLIFHSVITVLHRPSLLQNFSHGGQVLVEPNVEVSRSSARTLANMLSYADLAGPVAILANPFADQLIFISAMAFLDERVALELSKRIDGLGMSSSNTSNSVGGSAHGGPSGSGLYDGTKTPTGTRLLRSFADSKLDVSMTALRNITSHWAGVGWVIRTIEQKKRGYSFDDVDPDGEAEAPSIVLFPRDPAMIKSWLAREWRTTGDPAEPPAVDSPAAAKWGLGDADAAWDERMLTMVPPDVGLSFTGHGLDLADDPHLTLSLDATSLPLANNNGGDSNFFQAFDAPNADHGMGAGGWEFPMDGVDLPPGFFSDVVWGVGGGGGV